MHLPWALGRRAASSGSIVPANQTEPVASTASGAGELVSFRHDGTRWYGPATGNFTAKKR